MNGLRLVAVGRLNAREDVIVCEPGWEDTWATGLSRSIDLLADQQFRAENKRIAAELEAYHEGLGGAIEDDHVWISRGC